MAREYGTPALVIPRPANGAEKSVSEVRKTELFNYVLRLVPCVRIKNNDICLIFAFVYIICTHLIMRAWKLPTDELPAFCRAGWEHTVTFQPLHIYIYTTNTARSVNEEQE